MRFPLSTSDLLYVDQTLFFNARTPLEFFYYLNFFSYFCNTVVKKGKDKERDNALCEMRGFGRDAIGRSLWGKITGYSYRALAESYFSRLKRLFSPSFFSRGITRQRVEGTLKCYMLNKMSQQLGWYWKCNRQGSVLEKLLQQSPHSVLIGKPLI